MLLTSGGTIRDLAPGSLAVVGLADAPGGDDEDHLEPCRRGDRGDAGRRLPGAPRDRGGDPHSPPPDRVRGGRRRLPCRYEALLRFGQALEVPVVPRGRPEDPLNRWRASPSRPAALSLDRPCHKRRTWTVFCL